MAQTDPDAVCLKVKDLGTFHGQKRQRTEDGESTLPPTPRKKLIDKYDRYRPSNTFRA